jgi:hypothetical protein
MVGVGLPWQLQWTLDCVIACKVLYHWSSLPKMKGRF